MPVDVGNWINGMSFGKEGWRRSLCSVGHKIHQQLSCYSARDEARGLDLRSRRNGVDPSSAYFWSEVLNPIGAAVTGGCEEPSMTSGN